MINFLTTKIQSFVQVGEVTTLLWGIILFHHEHMATIEPSLEIVCVQSVCKSNRFDKKLENGMKLHCFCKLYSIAYT